MLSQTKPNWALKGRRTPNPITLEMVLNKLKELEHNKMKEVRTNQSATPMK
jgi:hypothetical protein